MSDLEWRLRAQVTRRRLSATDLACRLDRVGVRLSIAQTSRLIKRQPKRYTHEVLRGLCEALRCGITDLLWYLPDEPKASADDGKDRASKARASAPKLPRKVRLR